MLISEHSHQRLQHLYEISRLLLSFESTETTFDRALALAAETLPLSSAVLIEDRGGSAKMIFWPSRDLSPAELSAAKANAEHAFWYLTDTTESLPLVDEEGRTTLPRPPPESVDRRRFVVLPLVVPGRRPFGALQLAGTSALDEAGLVFLNAIANGLALAIDRRRAWERDISSRQEAIERCAMAEALMERYQALVDNLDRAIVWEADPDTFRIEYMSARSEAVLGVPRDQFQKEACWWRAHVHPDDLPHLMGALEKARSERRDQRCEHRCIAKDGTEIWFRTGVHLAGADTDHPRLQGVSVDVTAEKKAAEDLRDQLDFTRSLASSLGEGVVAVDTEGNVIFFNEAARNMLGLIEGEGAPAVGLRRFFDTAIRSQRTIGGDEIRFVRADGETIALSYTISPIRRGDRYSGAVLAFRDITERVREEEARLFLLESTRTLAATLDHESLVQRLVHVGIPRLGDACVYDEVNVDSEVRRAAQAGCAGEDAAEIAAVSPELAAQALASGEPLLAPTKRGSRMTIPISMGERKLGALTFIFTKGRRHRMEDLALAEELARRAAFPLENARLYLDERRAVRLREQVLGVVSHDLKNPLSSILLGTSVLDRNLRAQEMDPLLATTLPRIQRAAERMKRLIDDLLDFASIQEGKLAMHPSPQDAGSMLEEVITACEGLANEKHVRLVTETDPHLPLVYCDRDRIVQVISNLIVNAVKVTAQGTVYARARVRGDEIVIAISDTGPGIKPEDLRHLFERYWRSTDVEYKGTGLGLAIARGIVEAHGGRIWAESSPGRGATFFFTLPLHCDRDPKRQPA